ncbi:11381_t:CDS:1, partial [Scutellospora calospora]
SENLLKKPQKAKLSNSENKASTQKVNKSDIKEEKLRTGSEKSVDKRRKDTAKENIIT